jgi:hypothetical protein
MMRRTPVPAPLFSSAEMMDHAGQKMRALNFPDVMDTEK